MKVFPILFAIALLWQLAQAAAALDYGSIQLDGSQDAIDPAPYTTFLLDSTGLLDLSSVVDAQFSSLGDGAINFGFTTDKIWLRFSVHNTEQVAITKQFRASIGITVYGVILPTLILVNFPLPGRA